MEGHRRPGSYHATSSLNNPANEGASDVGDAQSGPSALSPHVLEERARQHRQAEFDVEDNQEEYAQKAAPDAHLQKLAGIGHSRLREQKRCGCGYAALTKGHIFENGPIGEPAELLEQCAADEEGLVAINDPAADTTEIIQERDQLEPPVVTGELVHEAASLDGLVRPLRRGNRCPMPGWHVHRAIFLAGCLYGSVHAHL